jgi:predicted RecA/RadA family phage recombinase
MAQLTIDTPRVYEVEADNELPIEASAVIYEGAAVGENGSGYARQLVAGDPFRGFAVRKVDNSAGAAAAKTIELNRKGVIKLPITSVAFTDEGKSVYCSDSATFTLTKGSNTRIGYIIRVDVTGTALVAFCEQSGDIAQLTDSIGGTASDTLESLAGLSYADEFSSLQNTFASLGAKINVLLDRQNN